VDANTSSVTAVAQAAGVFTSFQDWKGVEHTIPETTQRAVLAALGISPEVVCDPWEEPLPSCVTVRQNQGGILNVQVNAGTDAAVAFEFEDGGSMAARQVENNLADRNVGGRWRGQASFHIPAGLPLGYHQARLTTEGISFATRLIVTPDVVPLPDVLTRSRVWGIMAQLYSVISHVSWGIGDFADLAELARWAAGLGADYVLINPIHAGDWTTPVGNSPYLPSSRLFISPLYIRPETAPGYTELPAAQRERIAEIKLGVLTATLTAARIERDTAWLAKRAALHIVFEAGVPEQLRAEFAEFCASKGDSLTHFAAWCVFSELFAGDWRDWEPMLRHPTSSQRAKLLAEHASEIAFVKWLQWVADREWAAAQAAAKTAGMRIGIVTDLAVGVSRSGADTWMFSELYASNVTLGVPPDAYNQLGQEWGQSPWRPDRMAALGYQPFIDVIRAALTHAGGVRIDHILGDFRSWWVPTGLPPSEGTYLRGDYETMIGIIALEAARAGVVVIGEDLGTSEPWVQNYLSERGMLGTSVLWFERAAAGTKPPEQWRELCLASLTTHDMAPVAGYLRFEQVRIRHELGLLTESLATEISAAEAEQVSWLGLLQERGLIAETDSVSDIVVALYRALLLAPSKMLCVALVDAVGDRRMQNQPGTFDEYPNWRVWLSDEQGQRVYIDDLANLELPQRLAAAMNTIKAT
jgi:4-alpha-glucanotransferase